MSVDYHREGFDIPPCDYCRRFDTQTPGRAGGPCECPSAFKENA